MNYYEIIKQELINNEIYKKVKDYSKNRSDLQTYYNVGKILSEAGKHYGERIVEEYSNKLVKELNKKYNKRTLYRMKQFYEIFKDEKVSTLWTQLSWSHYRTMFSIKNFDKIKYYIKQCQENNLSVRELQEKIKSKEYERLDEKTKEKLKNDNKLDVQDLVKNPIILNTNKEIIKEKMLQQLILENMNNFLKELGEGFAFIENEYKIKIGNSYNYIDLLLYNIKYKCYVVVELKITKLKKEHIGQIETYMNYVNKNIKTIEENNTIGIIITKEEDKYIMSYCSDERIFNTTYELQEI